MIDLAGDLTGLVGTRRRLDELAQLGEAPGKPVPREDGYQRARLHSLEPSITLQRLHEPPETLGRLSILAERLPDQAETLARPCLERDIIAAGREDEGPLGQLE